LRSRMAKSVSCAMSGLLNATQTAMGSLP
jgi:hypothetical protein